MNGNIAIRSVKQSHSTTGAEKRTNSGQIHYLDQDDLKKLGPACHESVDFSSALTDATSHMVSTCETPEIGVGGTVLLVDDDQLQRLLVTALLTDLGFTTLEAENGLEAVETFRQYRDIIRFVLCDVVMPYMDGWETLAALRQLVPGVPVILSSACDMTQVLAGDHPELPQVFLGKPYGLTQLHEAIRQILDDEVFSD